jgi:hypothetical protein
MNVKARFKDMIKEMYQLKPIMTYLLGRVADTISTYLDVKKYSPEGELNPIVRELFYELGVENSLVYWFALSTLYIPASYINSKILEKIIHKLARKNVKIRRDLYNAHLYIASAASFYASVNNLILYLNLPHISAEDVRIFGAVIVSLPSCFYGMKIYKKLRS